MSSADLRAKYLGFFQRKQHGLLPNASLIPENDPTVLFTTAGMHPIVPFLLGEPHPQGKRLCSVQRCIRTGDIDEVGDSWHLSFFEMLGNWSLGDYFKKEAIALSFEFLTKELGIPNERFSVTCFAGDRDAPRDEEAAKAWEAQGVEKTRIHFLAKEDNWWGPAGATGPCGPDTEMFYHVRDVQEKSTEDFVKLQKEGVFCEIWNDVLMQYNKDADGRFLELKQKNVDTGMGLERTVAVLNGFGNVYECDTLAPILDKVVSISASNTGKTSRSARIITDHMRAAVMILGEKKAVVPSNVDQGYVLRRFIRRSIRHARMLGIKGEFCKSIAEVVIQVMGKSYPELQANKARIFEELVKEEGKFSTALEHGTRVLERMLQGLGNQKTLDAKSAFDLFQSYGFPLEITAEMCGEKGFEVDEGGFEALMKEHQELSRRGAEQKFKGGLADHSEETTKLHTATHLLNEALRQVVDKSIHQMGSNITAERLRFDFNWNEKLTEEQVRKVEDWVNNVIKEGADVDYTMMSVEEAKKAGAQGVFEARYEQQVKVYSVHKGDKVFSREICGGPHVKNTRELGHFKITKQEAVSAGVRRIKAIVQ
ncbi:MAG: alanine--tRNA ligase [Candidatus Micrarchaeota archaeon]|nr:alanine--tRNA ligase [Candidatus Micrarchaeota archaeon]